MKPGASASPAASTTCDARNPSDGPASQMRSPRRAISMTSAAAPLPSKTLAFRINVSQLNMAALSDIAYIQLACFSFLLPRRSHSLSDKTSTLAIDPLNKGLGFIDEALEPNAIAKLGWNLLREDLSLPAAVLYEEKLLHNLHWMQ